MAKAIATIDTYLRWGTSAETVAKVVDIISFGDLLGEPNLIDVTTLSDKQQKNIAGILKSESIQFEANYTKEDFAACMATENTDLFFELEFADGSGFSWQGSYTLGKSGGGVDEAQKFAINVLPSTDLEFVETFA